MIHVWRFSVLAFALLVASSVPLVAVLVLLAVRARTHLDVVRGIIDSAIAVVFLLSTVLVGIITDRETEFLARSGMFKHYAPWVFYAPSLGVLCLTTVACRIFRDRDPVVLLRWRLLFALVCIVFAAMNTANLCSPGWCGRFGFPLPYEWWSDAIVIMNGKTLSAGRSWLNLAFNGLCLIAAVVLLKLAFAKTRSELAARDN